VLPRRDELRQVLDVIDRHPREGGIVYGISRREVDELSAALRKHGIVARVYHAGLAPEERKQAQDAFIDETCDVVVATVAFGMGIDRSNIRFVPYPHMPKSVEHDRRGKPQLTGRARTILPCPARGKDADRSKVHSRHNIWSWNK
jgi:ATP-dependent DNA helicase RecQ